MHAGHRQDAGAVADVCADVGADDEDVGAAFAGADTVDGAAGGVDDAAAVGVGGVDAAPRQPAHKDAGVVDRGGVDAGAEGATAAAGAPQQVGALRGGRHAKAEPTRALVTAGGEGAGADEAQRAPAGAADGGGAGFVVGAASARGHEAVGAHGLAQGRHGAASIDVDHAA